MEAEYAFEDFALQPTALGIGNAHLNRLFGNTADRNDVVAGIRLMFGMQSKSPTGCRAQHHHAVAEHIARFTDPPLLVEADLAPLPPMVQRYIRLNGAVGQPRVQNFRARFHGQIRSGPKARWMTFTGEQHNFYGSPSGPSRFLLMDASMFGIPLRVYHRYVDAHATMRVKAMSLVTMVDAKGPVMDKAETVTVFNDLCVFAPGTLVDHDIQWQETDAHTVNAHFTQAGHSVRALLSFNDRGELIDFVSDDRAAASGPGKAFRAMPWSTPLSDYRALGAHRLMARGQGIWHAPEGAYAYLHFDLDAIDYNVPKPS